MHFYPITLPLLFWLYIPALYIQKGLRKFSFAEDPSHRNTARLTTRRTKMCEKRIEPDMARGKQHWEKHIFTGIGFLQNPSLSPLLPHKGYICCGSFCFELSVLESCVLMVLSGWSCACLLSKSFPLFAMARIRSNCFCCCSCMWQRMEENLIKKLRHQPSLN